MVLVFDAKGYENMAQNSSTSFHIVTDKEKRMSSVIQAPGLCTKSRVWQSLSIMLLVLFLFGYIYHRAIESAGTIREYPSYSQHISSPESETEDRVVEMFETSSPEDIETKKSGIYDTAVTYHTLKNSNLRNAPGTDGTEILTTIPAGTQVREVGGISNDGNWIEVSYQNDIGWIYASLLAKDQ